MGPKSGSRVSASFTLQEKSGSSCRRSKELQIWKCTSVKAGFIGGTFSRKRVGLAGARGEKHRFGIKQGRGGKSVRSFVLRTYVVDGMG